VGRPAALPAPIHSQDGEVGLEIGLLIGHEPKVTSRAVRHHHEPPRHATIEDSEMIREKYARDLALAVDA
jgi:hypothetical protein